MLAPDTLIHERYRIVRLIGRGGMGAVYEAIDQRLKTPVALKQTLAPGDHFAQAFEREAQILAALHHQALPKVTDYFSDPFGQFLVMEYMAGADLAAALKRRGMPFPAADVVGWAEQALHTLTYLHTRQPPVIHRDIKPQNLKLTTDGRIVLLDFGLAKGTAALESDGEARSIYGYSPHYAPPEQINGTGTDATSDVYALAATLYHLLTFTRPPTASARMEALFAGTPDPLEPASTLNAALPPPLSDALARGLMLKRDQRPPTADAFRVLLREACDDTLTDLEAPTQPVQMPDDTQGTIPRGDTTVGRRTNTDVLKAWDNIRTTMATQMTTLLRETEGTPQRPGPFLSAASIRRPEAEQHLADFLGSAAHALVLVGDSGVGKTSLLVQWASQLQEDGNAVLFYRCGGSLALEIEREIARDFLIDAPDELLAALERAGSLAARAGRNMVLIFDAINEFRSGTSAGTEALLKQIDGLIRHLPARGVRVVLSCSAPVWRQLERLGTTRLFWSRYYQPEDSTTVLLGPFSPEEAAQAYGQYQQQFGLQTPFERLPHALRERLRSPLLLRMLAETYAGRNEAITHEALALGIFRRYYEQRVRQRRDQVFADAFALVLLREQQANLSVDVLAREDALRADVLSDNPDSSYYRLLDAGVLTEQTGDLYSGETVGFTYTRVGAYVLARTLLRQAGTPERLATVIGALLQDTRDFPLAWDTARTLLLLTPDTILIHELARSNAIEVRELVAEALVELYADEPQRATDLITHLLDTTAEEAVQTGLRAAYRLGMRARPIFLWAAMKGSPTLRRATKDTLYLIWRTDPTFTYTLLRDLVSRIGLGAIRDVRNILEFVIDLSVTIYVNNPQDSDVVRQTDDLYYELTRVRLRLDLLNTGLLGSGIETLIFQVVGAAFSRPIIETVLVSEILPLDQFFALPPEVRAPLKRLAVYFDPDTDLNAAGEELAVLLASPLTLFNVVAAAAIGIHAIHSPARTEQLVRWLYNVVPPGARVWVLMGFATLLPDTPASWVPLLEDLTERLMREQPETATGQQTDVFNRFDVRLLPLGLAYGKHQQSMPLFEALIAEGLQQGNLPLAERTIAGLGAIGFYYPQLVFQTLRNAIPDVHDTRLESALVQPLSTMRMFRLDAVDTFMSQIGAREGFRRRVAATVDFAALRRYIQWLGHFNNAVHLSLHYPRMRRRLAIGLLHLLADARSPQELIVSYTAVAIRMMREARFRLMNWTLPEDV